MEKMKKCKSVTEVIELTCQDESGSPTYYFVYPDGNRTRATLVEVMLFQLLQK